MAPVSLKNSEIECLFFCVILFLHKCKEYLTVIKFKALSIPPQMTAVARERGNF